MNSSGLFCFKELLKMKENPFFVFQERKTEFKNGLNSLLILIPFLANFSLAPEPDLSALLH